VPRPPAAAAGHGYRKSRQWFASRPTRLQQEPRTPAGYYFRVNATVDHSVGRGMSIGSGKLCLSGARLGCRKTGDAGSTGLWTACQTAAVNGSCRRYVVAIRRTLEATHRMKFMGADSKHRGAPGVKCATRPPRRSYDDRNRQKPIGRGRTEIGRGRADVGGDSPHDACRTGRARQAPDLFHDGGFSATWPQLWRREAVGATQRSLARQPTRTGVAARASTATCGARRIARPVGRSEDKPGRPIIWQARTGTRPAPSRRRTF
jgi:hypothetical protein